MLNIINDNDLAIFFKDSPLYSKTSFLQGLQKEVRFDITKCFIDKAYKYHCPKESDYHTFKIKETSSQLYLLCEQSINHYTDYSKNINYSFHFNGICQSCGYRMDVLLNVFSETPLKSEDSEFPTIFIKKIGQFPAVERTPEKEVFNYLTDEDKDNYKKALANLAVSYGIGAFAYFRRIIENEIKKIVTDISKLEFENAEKVRSALQQHEQNHQMGTLLDNIYEYLPKSLKELGDNPIKLLYKQLSGGIHEYSETECLQKAKQVDSLLRYVIKKVNSEKHEIIEVKKAMKDLRQ